jgi:hypothetical protein
MHPSGWGSYPALVNGPDPTAIVQRFNRQARLAEYETDAYEEYECIEDVSGMTFKWRDDESLGTQKEASICEIG